MKLVLYDTVRVIKKAIQIIPLHRKSIESRKSLRDERAISVSYRIVSYRHYLWFWHRALGSQIRLFPPSDRLFLILRSQFGLFLPSPFRTCREDLIARALLPSSRWEEALLLSRAERSSSPSRAEKQQHSDDRLALREGNIAEQVCSFFVVGILVKTRWDRERSWERMLTGEWIKWEK
jgi:hypothetical protein